MNRRIALSLSATAALAATLSFITLQEPLTDVASAPSVDRYDLNTMTFNGKVVSHESSAMTLRQPSESEWDEIVTLVDSIDDTNTAIQ